jgi:hypothetical protein
MCARRRRLLESLDEKIANFSRALGVAGIPQPA